MEWRSLEVDIAMSLYFMCIICILLCNFFFAFFFPFPNFLSCAQELTNIISGVFREKRKKATGRFLLIPLPQCYVTIFDTFYKNRAPSLLRKKIQRAKGIPLDFLFRLPLVQLPGDFQSPHG